MKKLEEDETIKDKGEQTRAPDCTLPKNAKNVQKDQIHEKLLPLADY